MVDSFIGYYSVMSAPMLNGVLGGTATGMYSSKMHNNNV